MFDKFGEFNSYQEINLAAAGQKDEGDTQALMELAKENGIDEEDVEYYLDDIVEELCTPMIAALGKLKIEEQDLNPEGIMEDWTNYIRTLCSQDEAICLALRLKSKSLKGCISQLLKWSFDHAKAVDNDIKKMAGISQNVKLGMPGIRDAHRIIKEYYLGGK